MNIWSFSVISALKKTMLFCRRTIQNHKWHYPKRAWSWIDLDGVQNVHLKSIWCITKWKYIQEKKINIKVFKRWGGTAIGLLLDTDIKQEMSE